MKNLFTTILAIFVSLCSDGQIISQYVETNSGTSPKGIEIWNNTSTALDFSTNNLIIAKGANGAALSSDITVNSGTLAPGDVMVIGTSTMGNYLTTNSITAMYVYKSFNFNGDDALAVIYGTDTTDVFGEPGTDPGSEWAANGVSTANQNIALNSSINFGAPITGFTDPSTRFYTVSTTPIDTLASGLSGIGVPPTFIPTSLEKDHIATTMIDEGVKIEWLINDSNFPFFIERTDAWGNTKIVYSSSDLFEGEILDGEIYNSKFVYTIYQLENDRKVALGSSMIKVQNQEKLMVSPNPSKDFIEVYPINEMESLSLYTIDGKEILHRENPAEKEILDISNLKPAIYFISTGDRIIKIAKE